MSHMPLGFALSVAEAGFKYKDRPDLALIVSQTPAAGAALFTTNLFQAAPIIVARSNMDKAKFFRAVLINAGQANACTGDKGIANCQQTLNILAAQLGIKPEEILPASTGVIGDHLKMDLFEKYLPVLVRDSGKAIQEQAAQAIMTTDTFPKSASCDVRLSSGSARFWGMAKGAGMICPNMATMLAFIFTDLKVDPKQWQHLVAKAVDKSFNALTIDGDTSTNDCVLALANGASGVYLESSNDQDLIEGCLEELCAKLAYLIVKDAEGGTKVLRIKATGAADKAQARMAAFTIGNSPLVKTAMYGQDPNWGRIIAALGRSGARFDPDKVRVSLAGVEIFAHGCPVDMDRDKVFASLLNGPDIDIHVELNAGQEDFSLLASDLTEKYIEINAHYRT
ncbi:bifunctional glutamate N-acetyltransferase/amino-acid acetyltransferase ArgJ [Desulfonatronovibrio magnus]|uniref:bifunctional glutamate N-acetyltransferase/amino-acid acetyltransferase ArgJ n=1 Tax=Desulfonatronovibrio magnus TaxID=698827 RepID=UPI0005EB61C5|nr:bifunctional glutamate N-acetyltransferase/amino-acid acetyltransferase ArgJ [Desulfonatronovibrio magnus]